MNQPYVRYSKRINRLARRATTVNPIVSFALIVALLAPAALGIDATRLSAVTEMLRRAPAAEVPAKAADLVKATRTRDRVAATRTVIQAGLQLNPSAAPMLVAAVAKAVPEMAGIAAAAAAEQQPKRAAAIAKAAASGAPPQARGIVAAVCQAAPGEYREVAVEVAQTVPGCDREVLEALVATFPALKGSLKPILSGSGQTKVSVKAALSSNRSGPPSALAGNPANSAPNADNALRGPAMGPPFIPPSGAATNVSPSRSDPVPRGGRNYAAP